MDVDGAGLQRGPDSVAFGCPARGEGREAYLHVCCGQYSRWMSARRRHGDRECWEVPVLNRQDRGATLICARTELPGLSLAQPVTDHRFVGRGDQDQCPAFIEVGEGSGGGEGEAFGPVRPSVLPDSPVARTKAFHRDAKGNRKKVLR